MIELTAGDDQKFSAYRADPEGAPKGAVIVLQDVFGLTPSIRKLTDSFAAAGYVAVAPALFDLVQAKTELGYDEAGQSEGLELKEKIGTDGSLAAIQATVDALKDNGKVALVGYNWGGYLAYHAGNRVKGLACAIGYYPEGVLDGASEKRRTPTLIHFAEVDPGIPEEDIIQFRAARPDVSAYLYPGVSHGFTCDGVKEYDEAASKTSLDRTLVWLSQYVVGQAPVQMKNAGAYAQAKTEKKGKKKSADDDLGPPDA